MIAHSLRRLLLALSVASLLVPVAVAAEDAEKWYDVEVIVFAHTQPDVDSEVWPVAPGRPPLEGTVSLRRPQPGRLVDFGRLQAEQLGLTDAWKHLERSQHQRPIAHFAWRQLGLGRDRAEAVRLSVARAEPVTLRRPSAAEPGLVRGDGTLTPEPTPRPAVEPNQLVQGTIRLVMERYLHLESDLVYQPLLAAPARHDPPAPQAPEVPFAATMPEDPVVEGLSGFATAGVAPVPPPPEPEAYLRFTRSGEVLWPFRMHQQRRMRSGEIHYLDHPLFGLLVQARPYEPPEANAPAADGTGADG